MAANSVTETPQYPRVPDMSKGHKSQQALENVGAAKSSAIERHEQRLCQAQQDSDAQQFSHVEGGPWRPGACRSRAMVSPYAFPSSKRYSSKRRSVAAKRMATMPQDGSRYIGRRPALV
jgi:hypothetical protein